MEEGFRAGVADRTLGVVTDFGAESRAMLVAFGGIAGGISMPVFEFFRIASPLPTKKIFVRDLSQGWYQRGVRGLGASVDEVAASLGDLIARQRVERVVAVGASAGGFAALLFGVLLEVAEVHAFSPQTFLDRENRGRHGDTRWGGQIERLHRDLGPAGPAFDLRPVLRAGTPSTRCHVHFGGDDALDAAHARHLAGLANVELHEQAGGGHLTVRWLRDNGRLEPILRSALGV